MMIGLIKRVLVFVIAAHATGEEEELEEEEEEEDVKKTADHKKGRQHDPETTRGGRQRAPRSTTTHTR